jgi:hypothetical protein
LDHDFILHTASHSARLQLFSMIMTKELDWRIWKV